MRTHPVTAFATAIVVGFAVKWAFFDTSNALPHLGTPRVTASVGQTNLLPVQKIHDMTFVFADGD
jgi:hypothetical protein